MKNHVNGLGYSDGKILVTAHGFLKGRDPATEKSSIADYKVSASDYIVDRLGVALDGNEKIVMESVTD